MSGAYTFMSNTGIKVFTLAICSVCKDLRPVEVYECAVCEEKHFDVKCESCGLRFCASPNQLTYVQEEKEEIQKEVGQVLTPPPFPEL